jgi:hypothetical protein
LRSIATSGSCSFDVTLAKGRTTDAKRAFYRRPWKVLADGAEVPAETWR